MVFLVLIMVVTPDYLGYTFIQNAQLKKSSIVILSGIFLNGYFVWMYNPENQWCPPWWVPETPSRDWWYIKKSTESYILENIPKPMIPTKRVLVLHIQLMPYICARQEMINEGVIYSLNNGRKTHCYCYTTLAITDEVIDRIHSISQNYSTKDRNYNET